MKLALIAAATAFALSGTAAFAQTAGTVLPGKSDMETAIPAQKASKVTARRDAPVATDDAATSAIPVPGNTSGIDSTVPAAEASRVKGSDAMAVPAAKTSPVPGSSASDDVLPKAK